MSLVEVMLAQPKQERELYLSSVCAHDSELFKEVRKYVEWEERMNGFLLDPLYSQPCCGAALAAPEFVDKARRILLCAARLFF